MQLFHFDTKETLITTIILIINLTYRTKIFQHFFVANLRSINKNMPQSSEDKFFKHNFIFTVMHARVHGI